jgi:TetR/AcrR family transcriptional repressor of nem operon
MTLKSVDDKPTSWYVSNMSEVEHSPAGKQDAPKRDARAKLIAAALKLVRQRGYAGTTVDELCREAGVTKGAFFHHFKTKDDLAIAAANFWSESTGALFASAPYHNHADPLQRVLAYVDFRRDLIEGDVGEFTCLVGTMVQEAYSVHPDIRAACQASIFGHAATLEADIEAAMEKYKVKAEWSAKSLALHTQAVLQGGFILAKAQNSAAIAFESIAHLRRYIELLFGPKNVEPENDGPKKIGQGKTKERVR